MGEAPKRGDGQDPSTVDSPSLLEMITDTARNIARAPRETVKGMTPLQRAPARPGSDPTDD
jgi:hypothetical protein